MGTTSSTDRSREQRFAREREICEHRIEEIDRVTPSITSSEFIPAKQASKLSKYIQTARGQLHRHGKPLTKPDLIAIIVLLEESRERFMNVDCLSSLSVSELNAIIRCTVYDPDRVVGPIPNPVSTDATDATGDTGVVTLSLLEASQEDAATSLEIANVPSPASSDGSIDSDAALKHAFSQHAQW